MKRTLIFLALFFCLGISAKPAAAQAHSVTGTWTLSTSDTITACAATGASCVQTVYRAGGACSGSSVFVAQQTLGATATTFTDSTVTAGTWCYAVTFSINGDESLVFLSTNTNFASVSLRPTPPTGLTLTGS